MAGPIPLLGLLDELRDFANRRNMGQKLVGGGVRGAATRGLLGLDAPEDATPIQREVYENAARASAPVMGLAAAPAAIKTAGRALKDAPRTQALETARQNAVKMLGLPENNTAMDRAKAMGFEGGLYHGTNKEFDAFDIFELGTKTGNPNARLGVFATPNTQEASRYAEGWGKEGGNVLPLMIRSGKQYEMPFKELDEMAMLPYRKLMSSPDYDPRRTVKFGDIGAQKEAAQRLAKFRSEAIEDINKKRKDMIDAGYQSVVVNKNKPTQETIVFDPSRIRSRFAAFDPARINENDLLASLAAMGISIPMILGLLDEERVD